MDFAGGIGWDREMRTDSPFQRAKTGNSNEGGNLMGVRTRGTTLGSKLPNHAAGGQRSMLRTLSPTFISSETLR